MNGVKRMKKWIGVLLSALIIAGNYAPQTQAVAALPEDKRPSACIACRACEGVCPQQIAIADTFAQFVEMLNE